MIYLDNGATSLVKPRAVARAMEKALKTCANPGRGGHSAARQAAKVVYDCRELAAQLFACQPEQVVFTANCTHGLNIAIRSVAKPGSRVVVSGFEHNAVIRPLHAMGSQILIAGRKLFDWEDCLTDFEDQLRKKPDAAVFTHVSNVFGYILPVEEMAQLCRKYQVPFVIDAAQSAGTLDISLEKLGASFIAMPGHKGLLGPQGTGLLLCAQPGQPLLQGGTGNQSRSREMPQDLPERLEAGTLNVPGIAGLAEGLRYVMQAGPETIHRREWEQMRHCAAGLEKLGLRVFTGPHQSGTVSFVPPGDCETFADNMGSLGIALRAGLHCAPVAHESAGTLDTGTVRLSFGMDANPAQTNGFLPAVSKVLARRQ